MYNPLQEEEKGERSRVLSENHIFIGKIQCYSVRISKPLLLLSFPVFLFFCPYVYTIYKSVGRLVNVVG
jgi:hypothetical protein